ncbi:MAG: FdhF/YdeP family oxidoreductase [Chloroflexota bacterium]
MSARVTNSADEVYRSRKRARWLRPSLWVSWRPNGIGLTKPNHYGEMLETIWQNRRNLPYAWRILTRGACDGCALGVAGLNDWTIRGIHLCTTRLNLLQVNTARELPDDTLSDLDRLRSLSATELRRLGRIPYPLVRHAGENRFVRVTWDAALELLAERVRAARAREGDRLGFYLTSRGITNEAYYAAQKVARAMGTNSVDNAARLCHAPSTKALKTGVGAAATTISYGDLIDSDLIVLIGANVANGQPVTMKYLYMARKRGARVVVINPYREPALEHYWVPSNPESALFGTKMVDQFFTLDIGGDVAFLTGALKIMADEGLVDDAFIASHTTGWPELRSVLDAQALNDLEVWSGASVGDMRDFAHLYAAAGSAILVWSMGVTQHVTGSDNVAAIINLALARGNVGRPGAGLMPIRGHSGVQGGAEMGCYATAFPGGESITPASAAAWTERYGFPIRGERGRSAAEMVEAGGRGELDVLWSVGGNFLETLPDPAGVRVALERVPVRVHHDIVLSPQMFVDAAELTVILPATTRYEQPGGGTETTTERRIIYSPEIPGPRITEARSEWEVLRDLARRVDPGLIERLGLADADAIRREIAEMVPLYDGIQDLRRTGDQVQWGGPRLCDGWTFATDDGLAHFASIAPSEASLAPGRFRLATRRGKQFNSMVWKQTDPMTGAPRDAILMAAADAGSLGLADGAQVRVRSEAGEVRARVRIARMRPGNVQMFFPEANSLVDPGRRDPEALVPDYNATVEILSA